MPICTKDKDKHYFFLYFVNKPVLLVLFYETIVRACLLLAVLDGQFLFGDVLRALQVAVKLF